MILKEAVHGLSGGIEVANFETSAQELMPCELDQIVADAGQIGIPGGNEAVLHHRIRVVFQLEEAIAELQAGHSLVLRGPEQVDGGAKVAAGFGKFVFQPRAPTAIEQCLPAQLAGRLVGDQSVEVSGCNL